MQIICLLQIKLEKMSIIHTQQTRRSSNTSRQQNLNTIWGLVTFPEVQLCKLSNHAAAGPLSTCSMFRECWDVSVGYGCWQPEGVEVVTGNGGSWYWRVNSYNSGKYLLRQHRKSVWTYRQIKFLFSQEHLLLTKSTDRPKPNTFTNSNRPCWHSICSFDTEA